MARTAGKHQWPPANTGGYRWRLANAEVASHGLITHGIVQRALGLPRLVIARKRVHRHWGQPSAPISSFLASYVPTPFFLLLTFGYKLIYQTKMVALDDMDFSHVNVDDDAQRDPDYASPLAKVLGWLPVSWGPSALTPPPYIPQTCGNTPQVDAQSAQVTCVTG
ncbi:uncharacterized protein PHACADRAFT_214363 [Phanerochaete carnosa HHB-10118-sp]|uniref:Uncharacterized protein n=1 Tax=Phanerochaete carnosa (strain HHB-10118-sp) TaxID=650164 RepID=K5WI08_PHACS|nr:uncharacterized protein PHACADRAFT_214363 [Phanerochaete carnosa HHB-10118-sp]EKM49842.1 hypothetical protein PHACADRAFT_214363 [Phanerochaete carnosa HHB-10118-sp]